MRKCLGTPSGQTVSTSCQHGASDRPTVSQALECHAPQGWLSSLLKIQSSSVADSAFHVYRLGSGAIWIACDAINSWSCSGHQVSQSAEVVGCSRKGEQPPHL